MLVYAGIDEAGYGPMLGPLCVGATAFVLREPPDDDRAPNLWKLLDRAVCRSKRDRRNRLAIDDSKKLKGANSTTRTHPLRHLERGVLAALAVSSADDLALDDGALLARLGAEPAACPWYDSTTALPVGQGADEIRLVAGRLRRALDAAAIEVPLLACEMIDAEPFNHGVERMGSKAAVNIGAVFRHVDRIWRAWPREHPRVIVDRQGGRTRYREELRFAFPDAHLRIVAETDAVSRYRLERAEGALTISFTTEAEDRHLPVALASMIAKYVRELMMLRMNRYFRARDPRLAPTAGYVQDARRYLREIEPVVRDLGVPRQQLVRSV